MTFELFTTRRIRNRPFLRNIVQECMPDCKEKLVTNVPFTIVIREFVTYGQPQFLGIIPEGVAIGFASDSFWMKLCNGKIGL
jgi:hypothetical protein